MKKCLMVCVTNDLIYDQRMQRICRSLSVNYKITLIGRIRNNIKPNETSDNYNMFWLPCFFSKGKLFYIEYQIRLFFFLMTRDWDGIYAVDLDTLWGGFGAALLKGKKRIYDAHEYFVELPELKGRAISKGLWNITANVWIPKSHICITVNEPLAEVLSKRYRQPFIYIRNMPEKRIFLEPKAQNDKIILYQGVLNVGRGLDKMIELMPGLPDWTLWLAGEGDLSETLRILASKSSASDRIKFLGYLKPEELRKITPMATIGLNLLEGDSGNYYYSLANKFFDYVQANVPQISMDFPAYRYFIDELEVGVLVGDLDAETLLKGIQRLADPDLYNSMVVNCKKAADRWHWEGEATLLIESIDNVLIP